MKRITREQFLNRLEDDWGGYVARFQRLSPAEQQRYLEKQGYASFAALLGHVIAWWQDGARVVADLRGNPGLPLPDYDVDVFNAQAVLQYGALAEPAVLQAFESQRLAMRELVQRLPDEELICENINTRLYYEIMTHWTEHELN